MMTGRNLYLGTIPLLTIVSYLKLSYGKMHSVQHPNIIMLIVDDLGIGDVGCYGNKTIKTPNIDKLASEGVILHHHLSAAGFCTPSRAALLTGRYPARYGLVGDVGTPPVVVHVASKVGLPESESTIAEALSTSGYATAIIGKWHLGSGCGWFGKECVGPLLHGFDYFYGILFTLIDEMKGVHSFWVFDLTDNFYQAFILTIMITFTSSLYCFKRKVFCLCSILCLASFIFFFAVWFVYTHYRLHTTNWWKVSPWMNQHLNGVIVRNDELVHKTIPFDTLFQEMVNESVHFIHSSVKRRKPFFLVHSFAYVHTPMFASEKQSGRSAHGRYGDDVEEMDSGVGFILDALKEEKVEENTIVYFVSDHGGHLEAIDPLDGQRVGGYNGMFKGGKGMGAPEGAVRVPGIFRWKGVIPAGSSISTPTSLLDILPTFLELAGLPSLQTLFNKTKDLDGVSFASLLIEPSLRDPRRRILIHHCRKNIHGLRLVTDTKVYKMYLYLHRWEPNSTQCGWGVNVFCGCFGDSVINVTKSPVLYELNSDPYEDHPLDPKTREYEEVEREMKTYLRNWEENVPYPPSQFDSKLYTMLSLWLQPF